MMSTGFPKMNLRDPLLPQLQQGLSCIGSPVASKGTLYPTAPVGRWGTGRALGRLTEP